jgi:hypothetical protein
MDSSVTQECEPCHSLCCCAHLNWSARDSREYNERRKLLLVLVESTLIGIAVEKFDG